MTLITDPAAPWNERESNERIRCVCDRFVDDFDPCIIDRKYFCDRCASDLMYLRMEGIIEPASTKTKKLPRPVSSMTFALRKAHNKVNDKTHKLKIENANKLFES